MVDLVLAECTLVHADHDVAHRDEVGGSACGSERVRDVLVPRDEDGLNDPSRDCFACAHNPFRLMLHETVGAVLGDRLHQCLAVEVDRCRCWLRVADFAEEVPRALDALELFDQTAQLPRRAAVALLDSRDVIVDDSAIEDCDVSRDGPLAEACVLVDVENPVRFVLEEARDS